MAAINPARLVAGGLAAGVVINLFEMLCGTLTKEPWEAALSTHNLVPPAGTKALALYWLMGFAAGLAVIWFYAAARSRFGPGPKTALMVALVFWVPYYLLCLGSFALLGLFPRGMLVTWGLIGLVGLAVATTVGAWVYREGAHTPS